jgi:site-specific DNA-methyltransferase (adenine-specific)
MGGVCVVLMDREYSGDCEVQSVREGSVRSSLTRDLRAHGDVLVRSNGAVAILDKVLSYRGAVETHLDANVSAINPFNLLNKFDGEGDLEGGDSLIVYRHGGPTSVQRRRVSRAVGEIDKYKALTPKTGDPRTLAPAAITGVPFVAGPGTCCTVTYLIAGSFDTEVEAENLVSYLKTKFVRFLVSPRKTTHNLTRAGFAFVPDLDMTTKWTDELLYARYNLTADEIAFIESQIKEMP